MKIIARKFSPYQFLNIIDMYDTMANVSKKSVYHAV
jgi:hypothetical protein